MVKDQQQESKGKGKGTEKESLSKRGRSRRHKTLEPHRDAVARYHAKHGPAARRQHAAERRTKDIEAKLSETGLITPEERKEFKKLEAFLGRTS